MVVVVSIREVGCRRISAGGVVEVVVVVVVVVVVGVSGGSSGSRSKWW